MSDMVVSNVRHQVTVEEYHRMDAAGVFPHGARIELVEGDLMETLLPIDPPQANVVEFLTRVLVLGIGDRALVRRQLPMTLGDLSEPEPGATLAASAPTLSQAAVFVRSLPSSKFLTCAYVFSGLLETA